MDFGLCAYLQISMCNNEVIPAVFIVCFMYLQPNPFFFDLILCLFLEKSLE